MDYKKGVVFTTALAGMMIINAAHATAGDTTAPAKKRSQSSVAVSSHTENPAFEYSARKVLGYVSEARVALANKQKDNAIANIDEAMTELNVISNTRNYLEMMGIRFGRVLYGDNGSYYIPIADDTYAVRTYARGPFWSTHKTTAVRDVELINVDIAIDPEKARAYLQAARQKAASNDLGRASMELKRLLDESIRQSSGSDQPLTRLQDNIYLTRVLIRQENYDGARYTLRHAKRALRDYKRIITAPERKTSAAKLHSEIEELEDIIQENNPTVLRKAVNRVDKWWEDLKSWTREKSK